MSRNCRWFCSVVSCQGLLGDQQPTSSKRQCQKENRRKVNVFNQRPRAQNACVLAGVPLSEIRGRQPGCSTGVVALLWPAVPPHSWAAGSGCKTTPFDCAPSTFEPEMSSPPWTGSGTGSEEWFLPPKEPVPGGETQEGHCGDSKALRLSGGVLHPLHGQKAPQGL